MSFVPVTPGGTWLFGLAANTAAEAQQRLVCDTRHMGYGSWAALVQRGYTLKECDVPAQYPPLWYGSGAGGASH
jgi:hypothetical protein